MPYPAISLKDVISNSLRMVYTEHSTSSGFYTKLIHYLTLNNQNLLASLCKLIVDPEESDMFDLHLNAIKLNLQLAEVLLKIRQKEYQAQIIDGGELTDY